MKKFLLASLAILWSINLFSQTPTHRIKFKYRITSPKIKSLAARGIILKDAKGTPVIICDQANVLKSFVTNTNGILKIDPWAISDPSVNPAAEDTDPCLNKAGIVNANTLYPLSIDIQRGFDHPGQPVVVGYPTETVWLPYQTWIIGVNTLGVKFRPKVKDYNENEYSVNAITGSINAGITVGYSFGWTCFTHRSTTSWSLTPSFSLGLASATLAKEILKKQIVTTYNPSNFILSPQFGFILGRNDLGLLVTYGKDYMMGSNSSAWAYQGKHFIGIGLSASFKL